MAKPKKPSSKRTRKPETKAHYGQARDKKGHFVKRGKGEVAAKDVKVAKSVLESPTLLKQFGVRTPAKLKKAITKLGGLNTARGYAMFLRVLYGKDTADKFIVKLYGKG